MLGFEPKKEYIQKMISDVDDGIIEYKQFLKMMIHNNLNRHPKDEILKAFKQITQDRSVIEIIIIKHSCSEAVFSVVAVLWVKSGVACCAA